GSLTRELGLLNIENFIMIIDQIKKTSFYIQLYFQGEPFINKNIFKMIKYARKYKIYTSISTNGLLLNSDKIDKIIENPPDKLIFSIDGMSEETYKKYRVGGKFSEAIESLTLLMEKKKISNSKLPFIELQFIAMKHNEHEIDDFLKFGNKIGADKSVIKSMQVSSYESALEFLPKNSKYSRYIVRDGKLLFKNKLKNKCFSLWRTSVITWDGVVTPCCFDKDAKYSFGNVFPESFNSIWKNKKYNNFRKAILTSRKEIDICKNCTEGLNMNIIEK
ncbi:MAG TPA: radical SAM/SPASM domain-containing protein, partial [Melioribacteraceae bacterium]|nr:radical SAM/SPASM domain-containing protein [Melioribacteraceae bacterium]